MLEVGDAGKDTIDWRDGKGRRDSLFMAETHPVYPRDDSTPAMWLDSILLMLA